MCVCVCVVAEHTCLNVPGKQEGVCVCACACVRGGGESVWLRCDVERKREGVFK